MPRQFLFYLLDHSNNIWPWIQILKPFIRQFYFQSLSNFNYKILTAFHLLHSTFLKSYGRAIFFPQEPLLVSVLF